MTAGLRTFVALSVLGLPGAPRATSPVSTVHLRVFTHAAMDSEGIELARATATSLLAVARIGVEWSNCGSVQGPCGSPDDVVQATVLLMPVPKMTEDDVSAEAVHDPSTRVPTILVYLPNLADRVRAIHQSAEGRSNPALASLQLGHLVGLAIAHEVGHAFGLQHAASGVMKPSLGTDDLLALRMSRLAFTSQNASALRESLVAFAR